MAQLSRREILRWGARCGLAAIAGPGLGCGFDSGGRSMAKPPSQFDAGFAGKIGAARRDITPPVGIYARNWGAAAHDVAEGIHHPFTATALSLQASDGGAPCLLVAMDLGWWRTREDEEFVRVALLEALGLESARVMVHLSHTHSGPSICREDAEKPGGHLIAPYLAKVRDAAIEAARAALASAAPATLAWTSGRCGLARNRDLQDPERDRVVCGVNPSAPADDTVLVGRATDERGRCVATIVNYACHPTTLAWENRLLSPDYVGALRQVVESRTDGAPCLYLHGASGELAPRDQYTGDVETADRNGRQLGFAAVSALEGMLPPRTELRYAGVVESGAPLATWRREVRAPSGRLEARLLEVELPLKPLPSIEEIDAELARCEDRVQAERLRRKRRVRRIVGGGSTVRVPVWAWRVGEGFILGQPNEAYSQLQRELRRRQAARPVAVMNLVNGSIGYLPPEGLYGRDLYQVWQTPFERGSLERLVEACGAALDDLASR